VTRLKPLSIEKLVVDGFPEEHVDELGPATLREQIAKIND